MEFLLQLFADFLGTPAEDTTGYKEEVREQNVEIVDAPTVEEKLEEEPVLFGLMQFH
jgi:hypothetical protein